MLRLGSRLGVFLAMKVIGTSLYLCRLGKQSELDRHLFIPAITSLVIEGSLAAMTVGFTAVSKLRFWAAHLHMGICFSRLLTQLAFFTGSLVGISGDNLHDWVSIASYLDEVPCCCRVNSVFLVVGHYVPREFPPAQSCSIDFVLFTADLYNCTALFLPWKRLPSFSTFPFQPCRLNSLSL